MDKETLRELIRQLLEEEDRSCPVKLVKVPSIVISEKDRMDTGDESHFVYTHDLFSLEESPNLGCGIMEMEHTTFPWKLQYDEIDYVISGSLTIYCGEKAVTAKQGELIFLPKGCEILFSTEDQARFLYVTYPADWKNV